MTSEQRLHPAAFLVHVLGGLRDVIVPLAFALFAGARNPGTGTLIALAAVGMSVVIGYTRWRTTRYWVDDGALHFRSGVFSPDTQVVPIGRIAAVDEVQGPVQRLFGVVALDVQTAGGGSGGEIRLTAVSREAAAALRAALGHPAAPAEDEGDVVEWRLSRRALVLAAVTGPQLGILAPVTGGIAALGQQLFGQDEAGEVVRRLPGTVHGWVLLAAALAAAALLVSLAGAIVAFSGFVVRREPERLRLRRGLLQRRAATVGIGRVHAVRIVEGALRQPLGYCSVRLEVAGYAAERSAARTLVPLCRRDEVAAVLARLVPELPVPGGPPERPPVRARRRYTTVPALAGAAAGAIAAAIVAVAGGPAWTWAAVAAGGLAGVAVGAGRWRAAGWWQDGAVVAVRSRALLARTVTVAAVRRLQHRELSCSLPARRAGLASVGFAVASGARAAVAHLDRGVARELVGRLSPDPRVTGGSGLSPGSARPPG
jgi:putative membrane protein